MDWKKRHEKLIISHLNKHKHINEHEKKRALLLGKAKGLKESWWEKVK